MRLPPELEQAIRKADDELIPRLLDKFRAALSVVVRALDILHAGSSDVSSDYAVISDWHGPRDSTQVSERIEQLAVLLREHDIEALEAANALERTLGRHAPHEAMKKLRTALNRYDFDGAEMALESVVNLLKENHKDEE